MYPKQAFFALPIVRLELPGWGAVYRALGGAVPVGSQRWKGAPVKTIRGKVHGLKMELHLENWSERMSYFLGRYYELPTHILLKKLLGPGDRFVDVGANIGMVSLIAEKCIGPNGVIDAFEPNPVCQERMRRMLELNDIGNVRLHGVGLSDTEAMLTLSITDDHTGVGTFGKIEGVAADRIHGQLLKVEVGDAILLKDPHQIRLIKIDVEGFETRTLRGLANIIRRDHPMFMTETIDAHLRRAGSSAGELFEFMSEQGYRALNIGLKRKGFAHTLDLKSAESPRAIDQNDTLWLHGQHFSEAEALGLSLVR